MSHAMSAKRILSCMECVVPLFANLQENRIGITNRPYHTHLYLCGSKEHVDHPHASCSLSLSPRTLDGFKFIFSAKPPPPIREMARSLFCSRKHTFHLGQTGTLLLSLFMSELRIVRTPFIRLSLFRSAHIFNEPDYGSFGATLFIYPRSSKVIKTTGFSYPSLDDYLRGLL
jgi:hypothetical protein